MLVFAGIILLSLMVQIKLRQLAVAAGRGRAVVREVMLRGELGIPM